MKYLKVFPSETLKSYIHCYYIWEDNSTREQPLIVESPPSGYAALVINYGDPYFVYDGIDFISLPRVFVTGQATERYTLKFTGNIKNLGIVLRPTGLYHLVKQSVLPLTDQRIDLEDFIGSSARKILDKIIMEQTDENKIKQVEQFLLDVLSRIKMNVIDMAANYIEENKGMIKISEITEIFNISNRHLQKRFINDVGISPKRYANIRRLSHICYLLATQKDIDWQDIIYFGGFYDQSHFIKEFKAFMKRNPSIYVQNNRELVKFL